MELTEEVKTHAHHSREKRLTERGKQILSYG